MKNMLRIMMDRVNALKLDGIPVEYRHMVGASMWNRARNKSSYMKTAKRLIKDNTEPLPTKANEFMESYISNYMTDIQNYCSKEVIEACDLPTLPTLIRLPRSKYYFQLLLNTIGEYFKRSKPTEIAIHPQVLRLFDEHIKMLERGLTWLLSMPAEVQTEMLLFGIKSGVSMGYDIWTVQEKETFVSEFHDFCKTHLEIEVEFTVKGVLEAVSKAMALKRFFPFTEFYRTQSSINKPLKTRAVFGGSLLHKAYGAIIYAIKHKFQDFHVVEYNHVPVIAWENWDEMFSRLTFKVQDAIDNKFEVVGEDFTGFDQSITLEDLKWMIDYFVKPDKKISGIGLMYIYTIYCLRFSEVYVGPLRLTHIFFKSGHPFTSEFGSWVHLNIIFTHADMQGARVLWTTVLSDDNLTCYNHFNYSMYYDYCKSIGKEIKKEEDASILSRDNMVEFLKVWIGLLLKDSKVAVYMGNLRSRAHALAQQERGHSDSGYLITEDPDIDGTISKLASYASAAAPIISHLLLEFRKDPFGKRVWTTLVLLSQGKIQARFMDEDLQFTFTLEWLLVIVRSHDMELV